MRYAFVLLVLLLGSFALLLGCGASHPEPDEHGTEGGEEVFRPTDDHPTDDHPDDVARAPGACPRSFGDRSPSCSGEDYPVGCTYPEGACGCSQPTYCGGAAPPPMPVTWMCSAPPVPCPRAGSACSGTTRCSDDPCGLHGVACENGVWTLFMMPPPP